MAVVVPSRRAGCLRRILEALAIIAILAIIMVLWFTLNPWDSWDKLFVEAPATLMAEFQERRAEVYPTPDPTPYIVNSQGLCPPQLPPVALSNGSFECKASP